MADDASKSEQDLYSLENFMSYVSSLFAGLEVALVMGGRLVREGGVETFKYAKLLPDDMIEDLKKFTDGFGRLYRSAKELHGLYRRMKVRPEDERYRKDFEYGLSNLRTSFRRFLSGAEGKGLSEFIHSLSKYKGEIESGIGKGEAKEDEVRTDAIGSIEKIENFEGRLEEPYELFEHLEYEPRGHEPEVVPEAQPPKRKRPPEVTVLTTLLILVAGFGAFKFLQMRTGLIEAEQIGQTGFSLLPSALSLEFLFVLIFSTMIGFYLFVRLMKKWKKL